MAKKKATMTLKDFHGGSIPSDLPLPSAPGVVVRPSNNAGFDRQTSWGNSIGRQDHRLRPGSAGAVRTYDDKTPFLTNRVQIGRNFDEDERKPLGGVSAPRRTISDENVRGGGMIHQEPKLDYPLAGNVPSRPATTPVSQLSRGNTGSYAARFSEAANAGVNSQNVSSAKPYLGSGGKDLGPSYRNSGVENTRQAVSGSIPNAWGLRKEAVGVAEPVATSWSAPDAAAKLAHASALEKVSSGRWLSNQHKQIDVEVIRHSEFEAQVQTKEYVYNTSSYDPLVVPGGREFHDASLARHAGRSLAVNDGMLVGWELSAYDSRTSMHSDKKDNLLTYTNDVQGQSSRNAGTVGVSELRPSTPSELSERPKLKLLPRSKPVDNMEPVVAYKQTIAHPTKPSQVDTENATYRNANSSVHGLAGPEGSHPAVQRPKMNLRPRSQPPEQLERNAEKERNSLFGGARPRELVLKERGVDDVVYPETIQSPNRAKKETQRAENLQVQSTVSPRQNGKSAERSDAQRRSNWRKENPKNKRDAQEKERPPSPETWRKPVDTAPRHGKVASAVELAQAFAKSASDPKVAAATAATSRFSGQRRLPGQTQIPFSRLTTHPTRPQINGH